MVTSGGGDEAPIAEYLQHFLATSGAIPVGAVWATMGRIPGYDFPSETREKAFALGERLVKAWWSEEVTPKYKKVTRDFKKRMRALMLWRKEGLAL